MTIDSLYQRFLECSGACTDTRHITNNSMFFALKGENFNGNTFADKALENGAKYVVIDEEAYKTSPKHILVDHVLTTLQHLATHHRKQLNTPIIALTGSNGKTTTKELIKAVLSQKYQVSATKGNLNNHIGVPLTLLDLKKETEIAVVEMGANHHHEIDFLCGLTLPDFGLITNFGKAHLEGFGSLDGVVKAKSELYNHLKNHNKPIFLNEADKTQVAQVGQYYNTIPFGPNAKKTTVSFLSANPLVSVTYMGQQINSHLIGRYNFNNIAVAIAVGQHFNVAPALIKHAIENYIPANNRSQMIETGKNSVLLDAYNANPTSMMAALENFTSLAGKEKLVILGDMFELGKDSQLEHQHVVSFLEGQKNLKAFIVGQAFFEAKTNAAHLHAFKGYQDLAEHLKNSPISGQHILIKGSRGMALERALDLL
ncbi:MAG: UDP-N-acetylmuramoyl-tripeptide--D-alanyl-D-alanine ligase [Algicola sp.]|nr:UDP-N-acetylmuramoyl-tripeptide--D-alanyl-D-alanine ligase [Algicola sp.]